MVFIHVSSAVFPAGFKMPSRLFWRSQTSRRPCPLIWLPFNTSRTWAYRSVYSRSLDEAGTAFWMAVLYEWILGAVTGMPGPPPYKKFSDRRRLVLVPARLMS